jgi:hypothetical protein
LGYINGQNKGPWPHTVYFIMEEGRPKF